MSDPNFRPIPDWVAFLLAFIAGFVTTWAVLLYSAFAVFGGAASNWGVLLLVFPLAGLAVFQLLFGMTGRWRSWRFWVIATPVAYGVIFITSLPAAQGQIGWTVAVAACAGALLLAGFWALSVTAPAD